MRKTVFCLVLVVALILFFTSFLSAQTKVETEWNWSSVASGSGGHNVATRTDGTLWTWIGFRCPWRGHYINHSLVQIGTNENWASTSAGRNHAVAIRKDGTLWAWGNNGFGQLGDGTTIQRNTPVQIGADTNWAFVSAGMYHTVAIRRDGTLWAWGRNTEGQLGDGTTISRNSPVRIGTVWSYASAGAGHTVAISRDGSLWAWGNNSSGQLGDGTTTQRNAPVQIGTDTNWASVSAGGGQHFGSASFFGHTMAIRKDGTLWALGIGHNIPVQVGPATNWASISAGIYNSVGIRTNGTLWEVSGLTSTRIGTDANWNYASIGSTGPFAVRTDGTLWDVRHDPAVRIGIPANWLAASVYGDMVIGRDGTIWRWGGSPQSWSWSGGTQIGTDTNWVTANGRYAIKVDGTLWDLLNMQQMGTANWDSISAGARHTVAIRADGTLWDLRQHIQVGAAANWAYVSAGGHAVGIKTDGTLWAWGDNRYGQLGNGTTTNSSRNTPVQIGTDTNWAFVSAGGSHTVAIRTDGTLWAWGSNTHGQLGAIWGECCCDMNRSLVPIQIGTDSNWASVSAGENHTVAIRTDGTLWAWGDNRTGQLGDGTTIRRNIPVRIGTNNDWASVSACGTVAIREGGTLWAWGGACDWNNVRCNGPVRVMR